MTIKWLVMVKRRQRVLLPKDGTKLVLLDKRYGNQKKEKYIVNGNDVTVTLVHSSYDIEENMYKDFVKKVIDDVGFVNRKTNILRTLIASYVYGIVTINDLEEKLEKLDKEIFI